MTRLPSRQAPIGFAHRGARAHAPENTMEAFLLARRLGASGIETDAWRTADGMAVLDHDGVVGRRPRRKPIAEVNAIDLPSHIPSLSEFYNELGVDFDLSIDIKDPDVATEVIACARDVGAEQRLWLCHPDRELVSQWRELSSAINLVESTRLAKFKTKPELHFAASAKIGIDVINLHHTEWTGGLVAMVHRFDMLAFGWDAQFDHIIVELLRIGCDGIYCDDVEKMMPFVNEAVLQFHQQ